MSMSGVSSWRRLYRIEEVFASAVK